ncbi:MAG: hypothetical protein MZU95_02245 [Desulfomicrobium escambiense]|nr:hypothetical protein [Desulfomicrobium escambiense]
MPTPTDRPCPSDPVAALIQRHPGRRVAFEVAGDLPQTRAGSPSGMIPASA